MTYTTNDGDLETEIAAVPLWLLEDLLSMAQRSKPYRDGEAWTAKAVNATNRAINHALIRRHPK